MEERNITIDDIARKAKVSKSTVSRVLNKSTPVNREKRLAVEAAMKSLNYKPNIFARSLAGGKTFTLGVITQNIGSPFYDLVTQGVTNGVSRSEYSPVFVDAQWDSELERSAIRTLIDRQVDGLIIVGGSLDGVTLEQLRGNIPMVIVARNLKGWEQRCIAIDNVFAACTATEYLITSGHQEIAFIMGMKDHPDAVDRYHGYKKALANANIKCTEELFVGGDFSSRSGVVAMETLLLRGVSFSAVFAANDEMAFGARLALYRRGIRVPEDISIIGFDDQPVSAYVTPPLTTVAQPAREMGAAAAEMLIGILENQEFEMPHLEGKLVIRESVARIR